MIEMTEAPNEPQPKNTSPMVSGKAPCCAPLLNEILREGRSGGWIEGSPLDKKVEGLVASAPDVDVIEAAHDAVIMPKVFIDGVEYIPAKDALANEKAIARGLLMQFWGACTDERLEELINDPCIKVLVHDYDVGGKTLRETLDDIAKEA